MALKDLPLHEELLDWIHAAQGWIAEIGPEAKVMSTDYLIIEPFLHDALQARTLQAAFDLGIIDRLAAREVVGQSQLFRKPGL